jgi:hypothetical protein
MALGNERPGEKNACDRVFDLVQHGVEVRTGNGKVSGALG